MKTWRIQSGRTWSLRHCAVKGHSSALLGREAKAAPFATLGAIGRRADLAVRASQRPIIGRREVNIVRAEAFRCAERTEPSGATSWV